jgi:hypothetical protein
MEKKMVTQKQLAQATELAARFQEGFHDPRLRELSLSRPHRRFDGDEYVTFRIHPNDGQQPDAITITVDFGRRKVWCDCGFDACMSF